MITIFCFSARNADESSADSARVGLFIGHVVIYDFEDWSAEAQMEFAERINYPIRKTAHASEYCVLAILTAGAVGTACLTEKQALISWGVATAYAATDEFHQLFVPGRSGQVTDVCIDSIGALIGVLIVVLVISRKKKQLRIHLLIQHFRICLAKLWR